MEERTCLNCKHSAVEDFNKYCCNCLGINQIKWESNSLVDAHIEETKAETFVRLVKENPTLPIISMVDYEVVADDSFSRWAGRFGDSYVGEYVLYGGGYYDDREDFKETYYDMHDDELCERFNYEPSINEFTVKRGVYTQEQLETNKKNEKLLDEYLDKVAEERFIKAIIVYIDSF